MSHLMQTSAKQTKGTLQLKEISIIPITAPTSEKPSSSSQSMADEDSADALRKKRCTDRYDSSESSDSGVVTMSADSTATSDASDPGSPFSHTSTCTDDVSASTTKTMTPSVSPPNGKTLKRQAQVTEKCDKKRVRKELCSKNNNVEIKIIPMPTSTASQASQMKKPNLIKSTLSAIANLNVFKSQPTSKASITSQQAIPSAVSSSSNPPPNLAQLSTAMPMAATISKLTDYYKLKKEVTTNSLSVEKYCNMLLNLQSNGKQNIKGKVPDANITKHAATTITPIMNNSLHTTPSKPVNIPKKLVNEKKTAKIAPVIPVARKTTNHTSMHSQQSPQQPLKISPKKPVSIAPRIEPKPAQKNNVLLQPKPVSMQVNGVKTGTNGKLVATSTSSQSLQNQQQPTVLLAAIRIPSQQMQPPTQPPPLKMQNGLIQKTTTTTTTTTKLAPMLQFHTQQMIPNLIQLPNLIATSNKSPMGKVSSSQQTPSQPNLYVNGTSLTQQQQQQLFMNGAVIKLQPMPASSQGNAQTVTSSTMSNVTSINNAAQKYAIQQQQQAFAAQIAAQQMQQLFMTPVLFNANGIPTVLSSQLANLQHAFNQQQIASSMAPPCSMPALQPIQSSLLSSYSTSSMTSTTNSSMQLPSISTILNHNQQGMAAAQQFQLHHQQQHHHHQTIPTLMKTSMAPSFASLPPSLTITSGFMQNQQRVNISTPQATVNPSPKAVPPLAPASNSPMKNLPKLVSVTSSSSQTSPKSPPPLVMNQKVSLPQGSPIVTLTPALKNELCEPKPNTVCVVPPLPSPAKAMKMDVDAEEKKTIIEASKDIKSAISIVIEEKSMIECAKSPILSQPKTIRFPKIDGKVMVWKKTVKISKTGCCNWEKCSKHFDSNSDLLDHLHSHHINTQTEQFMCSWRGCKVNGCQGSKGWLERHVMSHVGSKPFKCIVERCGVRFSSQVQLEKHVNGHFNNSDQQSNSKRSSDPPAPKKVKKDQKKATKIRRQPWSARRFDFFDVGMMDILQYRLEKAESVIRGRDVEVTFKGSVIGKRRSVTGEDEYKVTWSPSNIIEDEWMKRPQDSFQTTFQLLKNVSVKRMTPMQRVLLQEHVTFITKTAPRSAPVKQSRKFSSTCSSRTSIASTSASTST